MAMKLIIDDAHPDKIREIYAYYPVDGVTTNPSILARAGRPPYEVLHEIRDFIGKDADLHVQVIARDADGMMRDAERILRELGENTYIKVPVVREGLKAIKQLSAQGVSVTATAIYTRMQAWLAGKAGAKYAAPYVNRIENLGCDGVTAAKSMHDIYMKNGIPCNVLAASFKNSQQVQELVEYGVGAATVAPDVIEGFIRNACVTDAVDAFVRDFEGLVGKGKTMSSL